MVRFYINHKDLSCKECLANVKRLHKAHPRQFMTPSKWLKLHLANHEYCTLRTVRPIRLKCSGCNGYFLDTEITQWGTDKKKKDGIANYCKVCFNLLPRPGFISGYLKAVKHKRGMKKW